MDIQDLINDIIILSDVKLEQEMVKLKKNNEMEKLYLNKINNVIPSLIETLKKENLEIVEIFPRKTGDTIDWADKDYMSVSMSLKPLSDKFKFIKFAGYTKYGSGKNQEALINRASKLAEKINSVPGLISVRVNNYSFEINNESDINNKRILVNFSIK